MMTTTSDLTFRISQVLDSPVETVWKAWTDEQQLKSWFGPSGCPILKSSMNFSEGGMYHYGIQTPDGGTMWGKWTFKQIEAPNKMVWTHGFTDSEGQKITRHPYCDTWPLHMEATLMLEALTDQETKLTIEVLAFDMTDVERETWIGGLEGMQQGWGGTLEQLKMFLMGKPVH